MSGSRRRSYLPVLLLHLVTACGRSTGPGASRVVSITASAMPRIVPAVGYLNLTVVREGVEPVFADSVQSPYTFEFTARVNEFIYTDVKWSVPRLGSLSLQVTVGEEIILERDSLTSAEALVVSFRVP